MSLATDMGAVWGDSLEPEPISAAGPSAAAKPKTPSASADEAFPEGRIEESAEDAEGFITIREWRRDPATQAKQIITRRVKRFKRVIRVPMGVTERAKWSFFGLAAAGNVGATLRSVEDVRFDRPGDDKKSDRDKYIENTAGGGMAGPASTAIVCKYCKGEHFSLRCPNRDIMPVGGMDSGAGAGGDDGFDAPKPATGKYIPPAQRLGTAAAAAAASGEVPIETLTRIRVGNLDEDATEDEIRELCNQYGRVDRVNLQRIRETSKVTAAYVSFFTHEDAARAMKNLDGVGYQYRVLKVEWARPNPNKDAFSGSAGLSAGHATGYGKMLPQLQGGGGVGMSRPMTGGRGY